MTVNEIDAPTAYFFNLEKVSKQKNEMYCLTKPDGQKTFDAREMRKMAVDFYSNLYRKEETETECVSQILQQLPSITETQSENLDSTVSFEELTEAVKQMNAGRAPGCDGQSVDFLKLCGTILEETFTR